MVIDWNKPTPPISDPGVGPLRAAEYVRMSTEHQRYSADNQSEAIHQYADRRGYEIVRRYADVGKSGLNIAGRKALQKLLADIEAGTADFEILIVYDVSRWGRFQDVDEAASYELRCRQAGVAVHYCAEQFENDGSISSSIIKTVKRAMAGEYSRELSVKVFAGQSHLIRLGFRQGGPAGLGLRRLLVDQNGETKNELAPGEHKSIATDRVILIPGPLSEIDLVNEIYSKFVDGEMSEREICADLNGRGICTDLNRPWTRGSVHQLLINEKYIGNNVWARTSRKLKGQLVNNAPEQWVRANGAFEPIVDASLFERAQKIIASRSEVLSDDEMLDLLRAILDTKHKLSGLIIDEFEDCPSSSAYSIRFGGLLRAYALVGFEPDCDYSYLETNRTLRALFPARINEVIAGLKHAGNQVSKDVETQLVTVNDEFTISVVIMKCMRTPAGSLRWKLRLDTSLNPNITIAIRMDSSNENIKDYYVLPTLDMSQAVLRLSEYNGLSFDSYRFGELASFYDMTRRASLRMAA